MATAKGPLEKLAASTEARTVALLSRLPAYFYPSTVLVVAEGEPKEFFFAVSFMFIDAAIYVLSSEEIPKDDLETETAFSTISSTKGLGDIDLIIFKTKGDLDARFDSLARTLTKHNVQCCLVVTDSESKVREKLWRYDISGASEFVELYFPVKEKVFIVRPKGRGE